MGKSFLQLPFYSASLADFLLLLRKRLTAKTFKTKSTLLVFTPNPEQIVQAQVDDEFFKTLQQADILLPDGIGLVLANRFLRLVARLKKKPLPEKITERITGVDVIDKLLIEAAKYNYVSLIIGGRNYAEFWGKEGGTYQGEMFEDRKSLIQLKKNLYWTEAYQDKSEPLAIENQALEQILVEIKPRLVFVALGAPEQEQWLQAWRARLSKNGVAVAMVAGGAFDFLFEKVGRAPRFLRHLGLEWCWRLIQQPWRWRRQLRLVKFVGLTLQTAKNI